jgi:hypothetical protein
MLVVLTLNFFLFEPKFVLVLRLTRLSSSRRLASCLCQDYNILLLFKRDILYTGNVEYILLCLCLKQKNIKIKQAFKNIQQPRTSRNISSGKSSSFNGNLAHAQQISQLLFLEGNFVKNKMRKRNLVVSEWKHWKRGNSGKTLHCFHFPGIRLLIHFRFDI